MTTVSKVERSTLKAANGEDGQPPDRGAAGRRQSRYRGSVDLSRIRGPWIIPDDTRAVLVVECSVRAEEFLLREGEPACYIFVVVAGHGVAHLKLERGWISLGSVGPGDVAGWSSLVGGSTYPASVKALTPMRVVRVEAEGLGLLMNLEPQIGYAVHKGLSSIFYRQYSLALTALRSSP